MDSSNKAINQEKPVENAKIIPQTSDPEEGLKVLANLIVDRILEDQRNGVIRIPTMKQEAI